MGKWLQAQITANYILSLFQKARELDFCSCNPEGKKMVQVRECARFWQAVPAPESSAGSAETWAVFWRLWPGLLHPGLAHMRFSQRKGDGREVPGVVVWWKEWRCLASACSGAERGLLQGCLPRCSPPRRQQGLVLRCLCWCSSWAMEEEE